ncbi:MAG: hypothetical protein A2Y25_10440 [Candidatus Melainabacteria bacterium GWF2_37_15]|nr:MAG: hypothetical protein A2Y25_10440 [Candidatus Melainabacteria bacterium GWF2_37_15]
MDLDYKIIGERIKKLRQENGFTQAELAERCNLSVSYISYIESAKDKKASLESLVKLADNLGVTVNTFLVGFQKNEDKEYKLNLMRLMEKFFDNNEKRMILKIVTLMNEILRNND